MNPLNNFDYRVPCDDFLLYELGRLIEEDKASFDEAEFRNVIDAGISEHVERKLDIRASVAMRLRTHSGGRAGRLLHAMEDIEAQVRDFPEMIESYTGYLFTRLEECASVDPDERITDAADVLLESPENHAAAEAALDILASAPSAISARVLTYAISEPILPEELENKAYRSALSMWPMSRHYILYSLKPHSHEDIPFRWFQLMIDSDEASAVDRILEELVVHGGDPAYREDLLASVRSAGAGTRPGYGRKSPSGAQQRGDTAGGGGNAGSVFKEHKGASAPWIQKRGHGRLSTRRMPRTRNT